jgi:hypothetical protein
MRRDGVIRLRADRERDSASRSSTARPLYCAASLASPWRASIGLAEPAKSKSLEDRRADPFVTAFYAQLLELVVQVEHHRRPPEAARGTTCAWMQAGLIVILDLLGGLGHVTTRIDWDFAS